MGGGLEGVVVLGLGCVKDPHKGSKIGWCEGYDVKVMRCEQDGCIL